MTWNDVLMKFVDALVPLVVLAATVALSMLAEYLRSKASQVRQEVMRDSLVAAITEAEKAAIDAVRATNQTLVENLKACSADGKLTKEDAEQAMQAAITYFRSHITPGALRILEAAYGPLEEWLKGLIEAKLAQTKSPVAAEVHKLADPTSSPLVGR